MTAADYYENKALIVVCIQFWVLSKPTIYYYPSGDLEVAWSAWSVMYKNGLSHLNLCQWTSVPVMDYP